MPDPSTGPRDTWHAADYAPHSDLQAAMFDEVLAHLVLRGDEQVLDLGCGDGKLTVRIAERLPGGAALGVDASADMVAHAQASFGAPRQPNLRFEVADARQLPYRAAFDLLVSFNALHWVPDQQAALRGIRRALKAGGRAQLRLVTKSELTSLEEVAEQVRAEPAWAPHFTHFSDPYLRLDAEAYRALAEGCGLRVLSLDAQAKCWDFGSEEAFFGFCHAGFGAWTRALPEAQQRSFVEQVMRRYLGLIADRFGECWTFHFMQTDIVLMPATAPGQ